jgi:hypothetical protein
MLLYIPEHAVNKKASELREKGCDFTIPRRIGEKLMNDSLLNVYKADGIMPRVLGLVVSKRVQRMKEGQNPDKSPVGDPKHLAHYTTADGLRGIIHSGTLWASGAFYLNDSSEIDYGCQLFIETLSKAIAEEERDPVSKQIFKDAKKAFEPGGFMASVVNRTYITCFCENENLLSQWRAYGQNGGYSLVFPHKALHDDLTLQGHNDVYQAELQRVIYKQDIQIKLLQLVLEDVISALADKHVIELWKGFDTNTKQLFVVGLNTFFQGLATNEIVRFKHPSFEEEREWRLIIRPTSPRLNAMEIKHLQFRTAKGDIVPYLELHPKKGKLLPIQSVRYGPTLKQKQAINSLSLLFQQKGYSDIPFEGADIPLAL